MIDEGKWISIGFSINHIQDNYFWNFLFSVEPVFDSSRRYGENSISAHNPSEFYTWTIGDSETGYSGFLYYLKVNNNYQANGYLPATISPNECDPYEYFDQTNCFSCEGCATEGIWCVSSTRCSPCYENTCSSCTGYTETDECLESCGILCSLCDSPDTKDCLECKSGLYLVEGFCIECPSLSSIINGNQCEVFQGEVFLVRFDTLSGIVHDELNSVPVITGNSEAFYPDYDTEDPLAAFMRGFYFDGKSSVLRLPEYSNWVSPKLVLSLNWTVEIWLNPKSESGCFFSYIGPEYTLISLCFSSSKILVSIRSEQYLTYTFYFEDKIDGWKILMVSFEFNGATTISTLIDEKELQEVSSKDSIVPNYLSNSYFEIGKSNTKYFTGFIYRLSIHSNKPDYYVRSRYYCEGYLVYHCLVDCDIQEYHSGPGVKDCGLCHTSCSQGCLRNDSCSLCNDPLCYECSDYNSTTCENCSSITELNGECGCAYGTVLDYEVQECKICGESQFYNSFTCQDCSNLCISCDGEKSCLKCVENASSDQGICSCDLGYNGTVDCNRAVFQAQVIVSEQNDVYIQFDDELLTKFDASYISVSTSKISADVSEVEKLTLAIYKIKLVYSLAIPKDTELTILFNKNIYSVYNSELITKSLTSTLQPEDSVIKDQSLYSESKKKSKSATIALVASSVGLL